MPRKDFTQVAFDVFRQNVLSNVKPREFNTRLLSGYTFYVREVEHQDGGDIWHGVLLDQVATSSSSPTRDVFFARAGYPSLDEQNGVLVLTLRDVTVHAMSPTGDHGYDVRTISEYEKVLPWPLEESG